MINNQDILVKAGERNLSYSVINLKIKSKWGWGGAIGNKTMMKILPHFSSLPLYVRIVTTTSNLVMPPHNIKLIHSHISLIHSHKCNNGLKQGRSRVPKDKGKDKTINPYIRMRHSSQTFNRTSSATNQAAFRI